MRSNTSHAYSDSSVARYRAELGDTNQSLSCTVTQEAEDGRWVGQVGGEGWLVDSIGRGSSHNIDVGPWFSKSVPFTQHSWTKKSSIKVQKDARDDIDCIH